MNHHIRKVLPAAFIMALAVGQSYASDAEGEYHGYFRAGAGSNSSGGAQACFGLKGVDKYRLGNECDTYGEWAYTKQITKADEVSYVGTVMAAFDDDASTNVGASSSNEHFNAAQVFVEAKNISALNGGIAWAGKRYYNRPDIHIIDKQYLSGDGTGAGLDRMNLGPGKFSYALFFDDGSLSAATATSATRHNFIYEDLPVNPDGTLKFDVVVDRASSKLDARNGYALSVIHKQSKLLGGENVLGVQYGVGPGIKIGGTEISQISTATAEIKRTRIFDNINWQVTPEFGGSFIALIQKDKMSTGDQTWTTIGVRPTYALSTNIKLQAEVGMDVIDPANGGDKQKLTKITLAPTLAAGKDFWSRPELRLFYTYARWNDAAQAAATAGSSLSSTGVFGSQTHGSSVGVQAEAWF